MNKVPEKKVGLHRMLLAWKYSWQGLKHALKNEIAFRQEFIVSIFAIPLACILPITLEIKFFIIFSHVFTMVTELLNSAIESIADLVSPQFHLLIKQAKDMGSLAVLFTLFLVASAWLLAIIHLVL